MEEVRLDKWLWAVRIFKTRSIATDACKKNRIEINGSGAKASRMIRIGDMVSVRKPPITYTFEVLDLTPNRIGSKLVSNFVRNATPPEQYAILEMQKATGFVDRAKGLGRPTKRDRRELEQFGATMPSDQIMDFADSFFDDEESANGSL